MQTTAAVAAVAGMAAPEALAAKPTGNGHPVLGGSRNIRSQKVMRVRIDAAQTFLQEFIAPQETNGDEGEYDDYLPKLCHTTHWVKLILQPINHC